MGPTTFGKSKAAIVLADILYNLGDFCITRKISKLLQKYDISLKEIQYIGQHWLRQNLWLLVRNEAVQKVSQRKWGEDIKSHLINVLYAKHSDMIRYNRNRRKL
ncbi:MAG TPA: hypothetical protein VMX17_03020 [Candidatus Glassbacteria bacterium]|nr:hypothetical protein [Candidatus Glassbacteria bacterium]